MATFSLTDAKNVSGIESPQAVSAPTQNANTTTFSLANAKNVMPEVDNLEKLASDLRSDPQNEEKFTAYKDAAARKYKTDPNTGLKDFIPTVEGAKKFATGLIDTGTHVVTQAGKALAAVPTSPWEAAKGAAGSVVAAGSDLVTLPLEAASKVKEVGAAMMGNADLAAQTAAEKVRDQGKIEQFVQRFKPESEAGGAVFDTGRTLLPILATEGMASGTRLGKAVLPEARTISQSEAAAAASRALGTQPGIFSNLGERIGKGLGSMVGGKFGGKPGVYMGGEMGEAAGAAFDASKKPKFGYRTGQEVVRDIDVQETLINELKQEIAAAVEAGEPVAATKAKLANAQNKLDNAYAARDAIMKEIDKTTKGVQPSYLGAAAKGAIGGALIGEAKSGAGESIAPSVAAGALFGAGVRVAQKFHVGDKVYTKAKDFYDWLAANDVDLPTYQKAEQTARTFVSEPNSSIVVSDKTVGDRVKNNIAPVATSAAPSVSGAGETAPSTEKASTSNQPPAVIADPAKGQVQVEVEPNSVGRATVPSGNEIIDLANSSTDLTNQQYSPKADGTVKRYNYRLFVPREEGVIPFETKDYPKYTEGKPLESLAKKSSEVVSTYIKRIGYSPESQNLYIEFDKPTEDKFTNYIYNSVTPEEHAALINAKSIGKHFLDNIKYIKPTLGIMQTYDQLIADVNQNKTKPNISPPESPPGTTGGSPAIEGSTPPSSAPQGKFGTPIEQTNTTLSGQSEAPAANITPVEPQNPVKPTQRPKKGALATLPNAATALQTQPTAPTKPQSVSFKLTKDQANELQVVQGDFLEKSGVTIKDGLITGPSDKIAQVIDNIRADYGEYAVDTSPFLRRTMLILADKLSNQIGGDQPQISKMAQVQTQGANIRRIIKMQGEKMYSSDISKTTGKELIQNSIDAVMKNPEDNRIIGIGTNNKKFFISDNGQGMTPEIIIQKYLPAGVSGKNIGEGGGLGMAKIAILGGNPNWEVNTIALNEKGQYVHTKLVGTGDSYYEYVENPPIIDLKPDTDIKMVDGMTMRYHVFSKNESNPKNTGTTVTVETKSPYSAEQFANNAMKYVPSIQKEFLNDQLQVSKNNNDSKSLSGLSSAKSGKNPNAPVGYNLFKQIDLPSASIDLIVPIKSNGEQTKMSTGKYLYIPVLNRSILQFELSMDFPDKISIPEDLAINIKPKVKAEDSSYPFTTSREDLISSVKQELNKYFSEIGLKATEEINNRYKAAMENAPKLSEVSDLSFFDVSGKIPTSIISEIIKDKSINKVAKDINQIQNDILSELRKKYPDEKVWHRAKLGGIFVNGDAYGVHFGKPFSSRSENTSSTIYHDPFKTYGDSLAEAQKNITELELPESDLAKIAYFKWIGKTAGVALHEAGHQLINTEGEDLARYLTFNNDATLNAIINAKRAQKNTDYEAIYESLTKYRKLVESYEDREKARDVIISQGSYKSY
jgi:KTSC domain/Histidine kinase-, DNA gyrase B-, and HSP90-like ATPase